MGWYLAGYFVHGSIDDFVGGVWPALVGPMVSLALMILVSWIAPPPPEDVVELFFAAEVG